MAHKEPFGLTPIEAFSIGTPAIFVNDGGFIDSIVDGESGRLISRSSTVEWHRALDQAKSEKIRHKWLIMEDSGSLNYDYRLLNKRKNYTKF